MFARYRSTLSVSGDNCGLSGRCLASRLCIQKFRSPRQGFDGQCRSAAGNFGSLGRPKARRFEPGPQLLRIQSKGFKLPAPFWRSIAKSLDSNAAWQTTFDRGAHEVWCEERERYRHVDLTHAALLT